MAYAKGDQVRITQGPESATVGTVTAVFGDDKDAFVAYVVTTTGNREIVVTHREVESLTAKETPDNPGDI